MQWRPLGQKHASLHLYSVYDCGHVATLGAMGDCSSGDSLGDASLMSHRIKEQAPLCITMA